MQNQSKLQNSISSLKLSKNPSTQLKGKVCLLKPQKDLAKLNELFQKFDKNRNNYLSYDETIEGCKQILGLQTFYFTQQIIDRAFQRSRSLAIGQSRWESKFINKGFQFKHFFQFLVKITQFWYAFNHIGGTSKTPIDKTNFKRSAQKMKKWTVQQDKERLKLQFVSIQKAFEYLDRNNNGSISFDEFIQFGFEYDLKHENQGQDLNE